MAVQISGNDITVPRDGTFSRNVSIAGTLTYEDVTNVDSIGLVTARNGIEVGARPGVAASISVDGNAEFSGIVTASSFVGSGANLTGVASTENIRTNTNATFLQNVTVVGTSTVTGNIVPSSDSATDIGTNSVRFQNAYVDTYYGSGANLTGTGLYSAYALMEEAIEHGATAHTKTAGDWYTKQLTRISFDPQSIIVSLSSNEFTLAAGTYVIKWVHLLERCDEGITRLYDVTNSTSKKVSLVGFAQDSGNYGMVYSRGITRVTISGNTTYKYQYFVGSANSILVGPTDSDNTEEEIFGQVEVWKEA